MTLTAAAPTWSRLIRFLPAGSATPAYGDPITAPGVDVADAADAGELDARIIEVDASGPLSPSAKVTDEVVRVAKLLGPLGLNDVPDIKCIGLNYRKHSEITSSLHNAHAQFSRLDARCRHSPRFSSSRRQRSRTMVRPYRSQNARRRARPTTKESFVSSSDATRRMCRRRTR